MPLAWEGIPTETRVYTKIRFCLCFCPFPLTSSGCRTRRKGRPFAPLPFSKRHDRTRVGRKERSDWSRQPGVIRSGSFPGALPRRQSPLRFCRSPTHYSMNAAPPSSPPTTNRNPRNRSSHHPSMDTIFRWIPTPSFKFYWGWGLFTSPQRRGFPLTLIDARTMPFDASSPRDLRALRAHASRLHSLCKALIFLFRAPSRTKNNDQRTASGGEGGFTCAVLYPHFR